MRTPLVTRGFTTTTATAIYANTAMEFTTQEVKASKGEDITKKAQESAPKGYSFVGLKDSKEATAIYGMEAREFIDKAEIVTNRRGIVTKEVTKVTATAIYANTAMEFITLEVTAIKGADMVKQAQGKAPEGYSFVGLKDSKEDTAIYGMDYDTFLVNSHIVER